MSLVLLEEVLDPLRLELCTGDKNGSILKLLHANCKLNQHHYWRSCLFFHWMVLAPLSNNIHGRSYRVKVWSRDWRNDHPKTPLPGDSSHKQLPKPDTIVDANKCLLTGAWYNYLLRGLAKCLTNTEGGGCSQLTIGLSTWSPMEEIENVTKELKRFAAL